MFWLEIPILVKAILDQIIDIGYEYRPSLQEITD